MSDDEAPPRVSRTRHPMLIGFLAGSVFGVGVSLAVAMFVNRMASPFLSSQRPANTQAATEKNGAEKEKAPAPVPQEQMAAVAGPPPMAAPAAKSAKPASVNGNGSVGEANTAAPAGRHFLQVGSFVSASDADNRKAKLALLGFEAMVRAVQVPDKGTVHRVIVGPFATAAELDEAKAELAANNYASSLVSKQAMAENKGQ